MQLRKMNPPSFFVPFIQNTNQSGLSLLHTIFFCHDETVMSCYSGPPSTRLLFFFFFPFLQLPLPFTSHPDCIQIFIIRITFIPGIKIAPRLANLSAVSAATMAFWQYPITVNAKLFSWFGTNISQGLKRSGWKGPNLINFSVLPAYFLLCMCDQLYLLVSFLNINTARRRQGFGFFFSQTIKTSQPFQNPSFLTIWEVSFITGAV